MTQKEIKHCVDLGISSLLKEKTEENFYQEEKKKKKIRSDSEQIRDLFRSLNPKNKTHQRRDGKSGGMSKVGRKRKKHGRPGESGDDEASKTMRMTKPGFNVSNVIGAAQVCYMSRSDMMPVWTVKRLMNLAFYGTPPNNEFTRVVDVNEDNEWSVNTHQEKKKSSDKGSLSKETPGEEMLLSLQDYIERIAKTSEHLDIPLDSLKREFENSNDNSIRVYIIVVEILLDYLHAIEKTGGNIYCDTVIAHLKLYTKHEYKVLVEETCSELLKMVDDSPRGIVSLDDCIDYLRRNCPGKFLDVLSVLDTIRDKRDKKIPLMMDVVHTQLEKKNPFLAGKMKVQNNKRSMTIRLDEFNCTIMLYPSCAIHPKGAKSSKMAREAAEYFIGILRKTFPGDAFYIEKFWICNIMGRGYIGFPIQLTKYCQSYNVFHETEIFPGGTDKVVLSDGTKMSVNIFSSGIVWMGDAKKEEHFQEALDIIIERATPFKQIPEEIIEKDSAI